MTDERPPKLRRALRLMRLHPVEEKDEEEEEEKDFNRLISLLVKMHGCLPSVSSSLLVVL